jgi:glycosyltransferase involved in cell wall biosynthesis
VPAIASAVGGLPELVGDAGMLIPPRDGDALFGAMRGLAMDVARRQRLRRAAYRAAPSWRWSKRIGPWIALYRSLCAQG